MWEDSGLHGTDPIFDTNHDGHIDAFESDHAECFLHDCDTFDQVLEKDDYLTSNSRRRARVTTNMNMTSSSTKNISNIHPTKGGYNIHPDFSPNVKNKKTDNTAKKLLAFIIILVVAMTVFVKLVQIYSASQAQKAMEARDAYCEQLKQMDLSSYMDNTIIELNVYDTKFYDDYCTTDIKGTLRGTERMTHQEIYEYIYEAGCQIQLGIEEIYNNSDFKHHCARGNVKSSSGTSVFNYKNDVSIILRDSVNEYSLYRIYPPVPDKNGWFTIENVSNNVGETWYYKYTDKDGNFIFELSSHSESDAYYKKQREEIATQKRWNDNQSNSNSSNKGYSRKSRNKSNDPYNSSRYKDADSFAEDYYEDFYDYEDYEDDDDAYDGAVDYWNDWND